MLIALIIFKLLIKIKFLTGPLGIPLKHLKTSYVLWTNNREQILAFKGLYKK